MRYFWHIFTLLGILVSAQACIYPFDTDLSSEKASGAVIEGDIRIGARTIIYYSRLETIKQITPGGSYYDFSNLYIPGEKQNLSFTAIIEGEDGTQIKGEGSFGSCKLNTESLPADQMYRLKIHDSTTGEDYSSEWISVGEKPVIDDCRYEISEDGEKTDFLISFHSNDNSRNYSLSYNEVWEYYARASTQLSFDGVDIIEQKPDYANWHCWMDRRQYLNQVVSTGIMEEDRMVDYPVRSFTKADKALSVRYHLKIYVSMISEEAYNYWVNLDKISYSGGDLFSPIPSDVKGNLHNENDPDAPVYGFISASTVDVRELVFDNAKELFYKGAETERLYLDFMTLTDYSMSRSTLYSMGYRPYKAVYDGDNQLMYYTWIPQNCLDCRNEGGTIEEPEGWYVLFH